ncbi:MAG TPA: O-antigen ligase family protein [Planctomycetota bacterium]|nr:O-antigen ligase family protein [Planctomycetota bacterium]
MDAPIGFAEYYRRFAGLLLGLLLGAYIVLNKPFALVGWPPLYIGEIVLAATIPAVLLFFKTDVADAIRRNWGLSIVAAFFLYGLVRIGMDVRTYGWWAPRDGVVAGYALLAVLAPALWRPPPVGDDMRSPRWIGLAGRVWLALIPVSAFSIYWALSVLNGWVDLTQPPWKDNKPDFVTLAAAIAAWIFFVSALRFHPFRRSIPGNRALYAGLFILFGVAAAYAASLVLKLPTRAVWISALPLGAVCLLTLPTSRSAQRGLFALGAVAVVVGAAILLPPRLEAPKKLAAEYELDKNLDWSIAELETRLRLYPETYPAFDVNLDLTNLDPLAQRERLGSLFNPNEASFSTQAGQRGAHANKWRLVFWQRAINYTMYHSAAIGIGFGPNITNVNRETPAWPMFLPAMSVGNRNPHSAHLTIFVRMGFVGLVLWLAILVTTMLAAIGALWTCRNQMAQDSTEEYRALHRARFFDLLAVFGVWLIYLCTMSFSVTLENPMGGMPFWALTGVLLVATRRQTIS